MTWLNWPNRITIARIILVGPLVICLLNLNSDWAGWRILSIILFGAMAISDALDGYLARRLQEETPLGRFLDPLGDKLLIASAVLILSFEATAIPDYRLPSWVPVVAIGKDVLTVAGFLLVRATTGQFFIEPRKLGKLCTVLQLVMVAYCLVAPSLPTVLQHLLPSLYWSASVLAVAAAIDYLRVGNRVAAARHAQAQGTTNHDR